MLRTDQILEHASQLKRDGQSFVMATVVRAESPTSAKPGAKALVSADGEITGWIGGGCAQPAVVDTAKQVLADGQARLIRVSPKNNADKGPPGVIDFGMTCHSGGTLDIFLEAVLSRPELVIIGTSPVARSLCALADQAGFAVRAAFPGAEQAAFPGATEVLDHLDLASLSGGVPQMVVVATQGKRDEAGLVAALKIGAPYTAFVASKRKAEKLKSTLKQRGHQPEQVDAIIAPAGLEIGAVTPEEIAVSVLAGVIRARHSIDVDNAISTRPDATAAIAPGVEQDGVACCGSSVSTPPSQGTNAPSCCAGEGTPSPAVSAKVGAV